MHSKKPLPPLKQIRSQAQFQDLCQQHVRVKAEGMSKSGCCPSWSLGNYLAVLTNASRCLSLTSQQVLKLSSHFQNYKTKQNKTGKGISAHQTSPFYFVNCTL